MVPVSSCQRLPILACLPSASVPHSVARPHCTFHTWGEGVGVLVLSRSLEPEPLAQPLGCTRADHESITLYPLSARQPYRLPYKHIPQVLLDFLVFISVGRKSHCAQCLNKPPKELNTTLCTEPSCGLSYCLASGFLPGGGPGHVPGVLATQTPTGVGLQGPQGEEQHRRCCSRPRRAQADVCQRGRSQAPQVQTAWAECAGVGLGLDLGCSKHLGSVRCCGATGDRLSQEHPLALQQKLIFSV